MKTRIVVFDFDNTLFNTINPLRGRVIYRKKTGKEWEHHGWYNREESLDTSIFSIYLNSKVKLEYEKHKNIPTDIVCMISERPIKMKNKIEELFEKNGLKFDYCFYIVFLFIFTMFSEDILRKDLEHGTWAAD